MALNRFGRFLAIGSEDIALDEAIEGALDDYFAGMCNRRIQFNDHPFRKPELARLSPLAMRKEIRILKEAEALSFQAYELQGV